MRGSPKAALLLVLAALVVAGPRAAVAQGAAPAGETRVIVQLVDGAPVRLQGGRFTGAGAALAGLSDTMRRHPVRRAGRVFSRADDLLHADRARAVARGRARPADLSLFFTLDVPDAASAERLVAHLLTLPFVETAYVAPAPAPPPVTPDFEPTQGHLAAAPDGIGSRLLRALPGGRGNGVRIVDVEYSWNLTHEDFPSGLAGRVVVPPGHSLTDPFNNDNHGTAVLGIVVASENRRGVTGIVPAVEAWLSPVNTNGIQNVPDAINRAAAILAPGDVMLIEQQTHGPLGTCGSTPGACVPVEWNAAEFAAIQSASALGIVVVEAAANGGQDLDGAAYLGRFDRNVRDSGAILVGAGVPGGSTARSRLSFSNVGSRLDLQGWGSSVRTTGYGTLQGGADRNVWYASGFGGTSSASAVVAGAVVAIQGLRRERGEALLTPEQMRDQLACAGSQQTDTASTSAADEWIGALPDTWSTASAGCTRPGPRIGRDPGALPGKDIWTTSVLSYAPGGGGPGGGRDDADLRVGGSGDLYHALLELDLGGLPHDVDSATLDLYCHDDDGLVTVPMLLDRITEPWTWTDRLWWADQPDTAAWSPGALSAPSVASWYALDVGDLVAAWQSGTHPNYGLELRPTENDGRLNMFASSDHEDPRLRPTLRVVPAPQPPACSNGADDDGDGLADHPADSGCTSAADVSERPACSDGLDDDGDGFADHPHDVGCNQPAATLEDPQCSDGLDNDGDGTRDYDGVGGIYTADATCTGQPWRNDETPSPNAGCGLGAELALLVPLLQALRRTRGARP